MNIQGLDGMHIFSNSEASNQTKYIGADLLKSI